MDINSVLASASSSKGGKSKSKALEINVTDAKTLKKIDTWLESSKQIDLQSAKQKSSEGDILDFARGKHLEHVESSKQIPATVKLVIPTGSLSVDLAKNQYSKISKDSEADLKKIFGDNFDKCFASKLGIKLSSAALSEKGFLEKLIKLVGADNFKNYFEVEQTLVPTDSLHEGRFLDPTIKAAFTVASEAKLVSPYSASFKN